MVDYSDEDVTLYKIKFNMDAKITPSHAAEEVVKIDNVIIEGYTLRGVLAALMK